MMTNNQAILFAGSSAAGLAERITSDPTTPIKLGEIYHHTFPSGECYCQLKENVRGADVFLLQSTSHPTNDNLMQLLIMADAARRASAGRITAVIPYMGYSRQDRKDKSRVPISAKLVMDIIAAAGIDRVVTMDLHAAQIAGFTNLPFDHLHFAPSLIEALKGFTKVEVIVAPDVGAVKRGTEVAEKMGVDFAFITKKRKSDTAVEVAQFVGDVKDANVLILDDLTESAGTIVEAAKTCSKAGARTIRAAVTHGCLTQVGLNRLILAESDGLLDAFYCSNTVNNSKWSLSNLDWYNEVDISPVLRKAIFNIHHNKSVSSLFQ